MRLGRQTFRTYALLILSSVALILSTVPLAQASSAAQASTKLSRQTIARRLLASPAGKLLSGSALTALLHMAGRSPSGASTYSPLRRAEAIDPRLRQLVPLGANVRVNDPSTDATGIIPNMTTQSEPSIAVSGSNIVVGYNDDGTSDPFSAANEDLTGYSWSNDGGATWHDSQLPNPVRGVNAGDPVVAAAPDGSFYFVSLAENFSKCCLDVVIAKSTDGGQTFSQPVYLASKGVRNRDGSAFFLADKPSLAVGPDPSNLSNTAIYVAWTDYGAAFSSFSFAPMLPIQITTSLDGGATWSTPHPAAEVPIFSGFLRNKPPTVQDISGSAMAIDPSSGLLVMAFERFINNTRFIEYPIRQEMVVSSPDAGASFSYPTVVARPHKVGRIQATSSCGDTLNFGAENLVRVQEFPALAFGPGGMLFLAYNSTDSNGVSQIRLATSTDQGVTWTRKALTTGPDDAFMPAMGADASGVAVTYYQRTGPGTLATVEAMSTDGATFGTQSLSSTDFAVPYTIPNFDPFIAPCYMGDYNGVAMSGGSVYAAWGDNRDTVTNADWPSGRPDPNVYFAENAIGPVGP
jgi:hypothetical protein